MTKRERLLEFMRMTKVDGPWFAAGDFNPFVKLVKERVDQVPLKRVWMTSTKLWRTANYLSIIRKVCSSPGRIDRKMMISLFLDLIELFIMKE